MANKLHKDLGSDETHLPKGFAEAAVETAPVKNLNGDLEYRSLAMLGETGPTGPEGPEYQIANRIVVQKVPKTGEFSSIKDAVASITTNSASNRFEVMVGPGVYVEDTITTKPYVFIRGAGRSTIVQPSNPNNDIFIGVDNADISDMVLEGATGPDAAAVRMIDGAVGGEFNIQNVIFRSNYHFVYVDSTGGESSVVLTRCEPGLEAESTQCFVLTGTGVGFLRINNFFGPLQNPATALDDFLFVSGSGNVATVTNIIVNMINGATAVNAIRVNDGGTVFASSSIFTGFTTAIYAENVGTAPAIRISAIGIAGSTLYDLNVEHPGTNGSVGGNLDSSKVAIDDAAPVRVVILDSVLPNTGISVLGDMYQASKFSELVNISKLIKDTSTLGKISGGELSEGSGAFGIDVAAGEGFINDGSDVLREVTWAATTLNVPANTTVFITVNSAGVIQQESSVSSLTQRIVLGRVRSNATETEFIENSDVSALHHSNRLEDYLRSTVGPIYDVGSVVTESGTRNLDVTAGVYFFGTHKYQPAGGAAIPWNAYYRDGVGGYTEIIAQTTVNNTQYDDGSGTLAALTAGFYAKHSLYLVGDGAEEKYFLVFSQEQYLNQALAEAGTLPTPPSFMAEGVTLIANIIVQQGNASIVAIQDARPIFGFKATGITASSDHGNLLGLLDNDHPQYLLRNGGNAMTGALDMGGNNIGNVGTVDGVTVSAHAARHLPNGADPLTYGTPLETTDSTNVAGTSNDVARGGHAHAHGNRGGGSLHAVATQSVAGFMSASDKVKLDQLAKAYLQYTNLVAQTNASATFQVITFATDLSSFPNSLFTKVNTSDFRADFTGRVRVHYSVYMYPANNGRGGNVRLTRNGTPLAGTTRLAQGNATVDRGNSVSMSRIITVSNGDIIRAEFNSPETSLMTIPIEGASLLMEVYNL